MYNSSRKKQRGQRRKLNALFSRVENFNPFMQTNSKYEYLHVPSSIFIEHKKTYGKIKTEFCRKWIKTAEKIISQKPYDLPFIKVIAVLSVPNYRSSQIIIFYDKSNYNSFWGRRSSEQSWISISNEQSFMKERNIVTELREFGYHEIITDEDRSFEDDLWFYGDLPER